MSRNPRCRLAEGFSAWEKAWAQLSFFTMGIAGTVGIALADWPWVVPYIFICWYGIAGIVMRHLACPRCPHLHVYGDCVQVPVTLTKWLIKERKNTPMNRLEKLLFYGVFILIPAYPLYWLVGNKVFLVVFLSGAAAWYLGQFFHFCKRCRVFSCPFNRVPAAQQVSTDGA